MKITAAHHTAIYEAVRDRDSAAARDRMREHMLEGFRLLTAKYAKAVEAHDDAEVRAAAARAATAVRRERARR